MINLPLFSYSYAFELFSIPYTRPHFISCVPRPTVVSVRKWAKCIFSSIQYRPDLKLEFQNGQHVIVAHLKCSLTLDRHSNILWSNLWHISIAVYLCHCMQYETCSKSDVTLKNQSSTWFKLSLVSELLSLPLQIRSSLPFLPVLQSVQTFLMISHHNVKQLSVRNAIDFN